MQYDTGKHCVFYHRYLIVWSTKYRCEVLTGDLRDICRQVCRENGVDILRRVLSSDHVHMFVPVPPRLAISELARKMKGRSSYKVQRAFPAIRKRYWGCRFRGRGRISTPNGAITEDIVLQYLELHSKRDATGASRWWFTKNIAHHLLQFDLNLNHLTLPEIKDFNALDDK